MSTMKVLPTICRAAALTLALIIAPTMPGASAQGLPTLLAAAAPSDDVSAVLYGIRSGIFRRLGLNVEMRSMANSATIAAAIVGGSLQLGSGPVYTTLMAHLRGVPLEIVAPSSVITPDYPFALIVKKDSSIQSARALAGKTYGSNSVGDMNSIVLLAWVEQNGGDPKALRGVEIPFTAMPAALDEGRIDSAILLGPLLLRALDSGNYRVVARPLGVLVVGDRKPLLTAWYTSSSFAAANPRVIQLFVRGILEAGVYANAHHAETAPLSAEFSGVDVSVVQRLPRVLFRESIDPRDAQPLLDVLFKYKAIDKRLDARELFSPVVLGSAQ